MVEREIMQKHQAVDETSGYEENTEIQKKQYLVLQKLCCIYTNFDDFLKSQSKVENSIFVSIDESKLFAMTQRLT